MPRDNGPQPVPHPDRSQDPTRGTDWAPQGDSSTAFRGQMSGLNNGSTRISWDGESGSANSTGGGGGGGGGCALIGFLLTAGTAALTVAGVKYGVA